MVFNEMNPLVISAFATYFVVLISIGLISHRKSGSESDFVLGNRSLSFWLTALSAHASDMSSWLFMALPAYIFLGGAPNIWVALGLILGMLSNWQFVAPRLRAQTGETNSYTLSTYFERHFEDRSGLLRVLTALMSLVFLSCYLSAGLIAMGTLLESLFGIDYLIGTKIAIFAVVFYTFVGGFVAVAWADLFQGIFLLAMILFVPAYAMNFVGEGAIGSIAAARDIPLVLMPEPSLAAAAAILVTALGWGLGYFGQPHIITKFMGIRDVAEIRKAKYLGMGWQVLALGGAVAVGFVAIGFFPEGIDNPELIYAVMVKSLFHPYAAGLILCAVIAANLSTMDSQILVCASVVTEDLYKRLLRRKALSKELLRTSRLSVILVGLIAYFAAVSRSASVANTVFYAWGGLGSSFGPLVICSLYVPFANRYGAVAGILAGGLVGGLWSLVNPYLFSYELPPMIPGFALGMFAILAVSLATGGKTKK